MSVDLSKLNKPGLGSGSFGIKQKNIGVSAQAAKNLANSSAATKTSIFSNSRPSNFVAGKNVAKQLSRYSYQNARARSNTHFVPRHAGPSQSASFNIPSFQMPGPSTFDKITQTMQQAVMVGQSIQALAGTVSAIGGIFSGSSTSALTAGIEGLTGGASSSASTGLGTNTTSLIRANSFSAISNLENQVSQNKANFQSSYTADAAQMQSEVTQILEEADAAEGLKLAGADNLDVPTPDASLNMEDLDSSMDAIDGDITDMRNFYTNDLAEAKTQVTSKKGEIKGEIQAKTGELDRLKAQRGKEGAPATLEADIQKLEEEIKELEKQKGQLEKAETAIEQATEQCQTNIDKLSDKKAQLKDIKQFEGAVKDKKYDLAKSQDKELKDKMKEIDKLVKKDKDGNSDAIKQLQGDIKNLAASLQLAGNSVVNSKNQTYQIVNLDKATQSPYSA